MSGYGCYIGDAGIKAAHIQWEATRYQSGDERLGSHAACQVTVSSALLTNQLLPLKEFSGKCTGEGGDMPGLAREFEMVASQDGHAKLITRLVGQAYGSCPTKQSLPC